MKFDDLMAKMSEAVQAGTSFGPPIERGDCTVVPVAYVIGGGGGGQSTADDVGSGFGYVSIPIGAYVIHDGQVRWKPVYDVRFLSIIGLSLLRSVRHARRKRGRSS